MWIYHVDCFLSVWSICRPVEAQPLILRAHTTEFHKVTFKFPGVSVINGRRLKRAVPNLLGVSSTAMFLNPFRTAVSLDQFWVQTTWNSSGLSPKRDCGSKRVNEQFLALFSIVISVSFRVFRFQLRLHTDVVQQLVLRGTIVNRTKCCY